jgi:hypothetical protein
VHLEVARANRHPIQCRTDEIRLRASQPRQTEQRDEEDAEERGAHAAR